MDDKSASAAQVPNVLKLFEVGDHTYRANHPEETAEGRDVVFSGQLLAQMIMASDAAASVAKEVRSIHTIFARAGTYTKPIDLNVESMHSGRTWASDTVTASQDGRVLSRSLVLLNSLDPDLMRHGPDMPSDVPAPDELQTGQGLVFPGAEVRPVIGAPVVQGVPVDLAWHRFPSPQESAAVNQAIMGWGTCGKLIELSMRHHADRVRLSDAHRTLSTGVIAHTIHFLDPVDVSDWLLFVNRADSAGGGRVYGSGYVFSENGRLVAAFHQDSMAKTSETPLDPTRSM